MIALGEGVVIHHHHAIDLGLKVFECFANFNAIGGTRLLDGCGQKVNRVIGLCSRNGRIDAIIFGLELFEVSINEGFSLDRVGLLDKGLWHASALAALSRIVNEVGHGQRPASNHGHLPAEFGHAVGNLCQLWSNAVGQNHFSASFFGFEQLCGHVNVFDVEFFSGHSLDAFGGQGFFQIRQAKLTIVGGVGQNGDLLKATTNHGLFYNHGGLDAVASCISEDIVFRELWRDELLGQDRAGGHVVEDWNFCFLIKTLSRLRYPRIDETQIGHHVLFVDELLGDLYATLVLGLIIALDEFNFFT